MFELLVMAAAQAAAPPPVSKPAPPPVDLIEFLGEWSDDEASLIDEAVKPPAKPAPGKEQRGTHK